jgi:hypothetical protein
MTEESCVVCLVGLVVVLFGRDQCCIELPLET